MWWAVFRLLCVSVYLKCCVGLFLGHAMVLSLSRFGCFEIVYFVIFCWGYVCCGVGGGGGGFCVLLICAFCCALLYVDSSIFVGFFLSALVRRFLSGGRRSGDAMRVAVRCYWAVGL